MSDLPRRRSFVHDMFCPSTVKNRRRFLRLAQAREAVKDENL
jgi:hypothetical protein